MQASIAAISGPGALAVETADQRARACIQQHQVSGDDAGLVEAPRPVAGLAPGLRHAEPRCLDQRQVLFVASGSVTVVDREVAPTESGALKKARAMASRMPGTLALKVAADDETGGLESATILGQFGEMPEDFAESLQGG